jgi:carbon storage regulator
MLVLTRKRDEKIYIGDDIVITVVEVREGKVRLGIEGPRNVEVMRDELLTLERRQEIEDNIHRSNKANAGNQKAKTGSSGDGATNNDGSGKRPAIGP